MKRSPGPARSAPMRLCGKAYASAGEAGRSKAAQRPGAVIDAKCPCGGVHVRQPRATVRALPSRPRDTGPSRRVRKLVLERDSYRCVSCGKSIKGRPYSLQHRQARGMGGSKDPMLNSPVNLLTLCGSATTPGSCHELAERRDRESNASGLWLRAGEDPVVTPVMLHSEHGSGVTAWLTLDGRYIFEAPASVA